MVVYKLANKAFSRIWRRSKNYTEPEIRMLARRRGLEMRRHRSALQLFDSKNKLVVTFQEKPEAYLVSDKASTFAALRTGLWLTLLLSSHAAAQTYQEKVVAAVIMGEASIEGQRGMTAVAEVISQRSHDKKKSPYQIVTAHSGRIHAFSCMNGTTPERMVHKFETWANWNFALYISMVACREPGKLPGITLHATHFTRKTERPWWAKNKKTIAVIGNHAFYRMERY